MQLRSTPAFGKSGFLSIRALRSSQSRAPPLASVRPQPWSQTLSLDGPGEKTEGHVMSSVKSAQHLAKRTRSGMRDQLPKLQCASYTGWNHAGDPWGRAQTEDEKEKGTTILKGGDSKRKTVEVGWEELPMRGGTILTIASFIWRALSSHPPVIDCPWPSPTHSRISFLFWCHWEGLTSAFQNVPATCQSHNQVHRVRDTAGLEGSTPSCSLQRTGESRRPDFGQCCSCSFLSLSCVWTCSWLLAVLKDEMKHLKIFESLRKIGLNQAASNRAGRQEFWGAVQNETLS